MPTILPDAPPTAGVASWAGRWEAQMTGRRPRIVVLGSANMDLIAYVAKAPGRGETVLGREFRTIPGGKGANQAIAAARAGAEVAMIGAVGDDGFGAQLRETLQKSGVDAARLRTAAGPTGTAHIVVDDSGGNAIVVVPSANAAVTALDQGDLAVIGTADVLLLQLELPLATVAAGAAAGRTAGAQVILTPAPAQPLPDRLLDSVDLLVPNEHEAATLTGLGDLDVALAALLERVPEVVITLGAAGCLHGARGAAPARVPAPRVEAVDTTAAGDVFVGALAVALAQRRPMRAALGWASAAAAISVQRQGASTSMPARAEIDALAGGS
jgi:ribokinase